jgi:anti-sigma regulatory factor (Ser/Thr protein kinase)
MSNDPRSSRITLTARATPLAPPPLSAASPAGILRLRVTSDPANLAPVRRACEQFCLDHALSAAAANDVGLCVNEAMANVTRHAYGGATDRPVEIVGDRGPDGDGVRVSIRDWGNGVNPADLTCREPNPETPGGLGLICLRRLLDEVRYEPQPDGMRLVMVKRAEAASSRVKGQGSTP